MRPLDWWRMGFALRCAALVVAEIAAWLFAIPTLFNRHSDAADAVAALIALAAVIGGVVAAVGMMRERRPIRGPIDDE